MRRIGLFAVLAIVAGALIGCTRSKGSDPWASANGKKKVLVSFAPLYSFAKSIAGDDAEVKCLLTTTGPHYHGDATPEQIQLASGCDVFIINGLGMDDDLPRGLARASGANIHVLTLGDRLDKDQLLEGACKHDHHKPDQPHEHGIDPHVWLSIPHAKTMVAAIRDELVKLDPEHKAGYESRAEAYLKKLDVLATEGKAMFANKTEKSIVTFHESLNYFGEFFGIDIAGVIELQPGKEPSADEIGKIVQKCQRRKVRIIAVEPQFPRNTSARVIRDELRSAKPPVEAEFVEIDPLETCQPDELTADLYERKMRENLSNLAKVLR